MYRKALPFTCIFILLFSPSVLGYFNYFVCKASLSSSNGSLGHELVDIDGNISNGTNGVGYRYRDCLDVCGPGVDTADFQAAAEQVATWLLPYLVLLAQIPLDTDSTIGDFAVVLLSVGTPTLALYSLFLTIINWKWLKNECNVQLNPHDADSPEMAKIIPDIVGRLQQFPVVITDQIRVASVLGISQNRGWWTILRKRFRAKGTHLNVPATVQLFFAFFVFIIAVVVALGKLGGDVSFYTLLI